MRINLAFQTLIDAFVHDFAPDEVEIFNLQRNVIFKVIWLRIKTGLSTTNWDWYLQWLVSFFIVDSFVTLS